MVFISVLIGLLLGVFLAIVRSRLDDTVKTREDVENRLGLPLLGMLQSVKVSRRKGQTLDQYVLTDPRTPFSEAVNDIRTAILYSDVDDPSQVVLLTSSIAQEGKTALACNLALAFGKRGRTLLLDGDLRRGRLAKVFGIKADRPGITDVVLGECALEDTVLAHPKAENLFLLCAGTVPPNPLEVVSSRKFARAMEDLRTRFDYIVIDGAPVLPVSDSVVLGHLVDAVVFTVQSQQTTLDLGLCCPVFSHHRAADVAPPTGTHAHGAEAEWHRRRFLWHSAHLGWGHFEFRYPGIWGNSVSGTYVNRNHFAGPMAVSIPAAIGLLIARSTVRYGRGWREALRGSMDFALRDTAWVSFCLLIMCTALVLSTSRGGVAALVFSIGFAVAVAIFFRRGRTEESRVPVKVGVVAAVVVAWLGAGGIVEKLETVGFANNRGDIREAIYAMVGDFWLTGSGAGTFQWVFPAYKTEALGGGYYEHAHNDFLELLAGQGVIGLVLAGGAICILLFRILSGYLRRRDPLMRGALFLALCGATLLLAHGLVATFLERGGGRRRRHHRDHVTVGASSQRNLRPAA